MFFVARSFSEVTGAPKALFRFLGWGSGFVAGALALRGATLTAKTEEEAESDLLWKDSMARATFCLRILIIKWIAN